MNRRGGLSEHFRFALEGLAHAFRTQRTFRIQVGIAAAVLVLILLLRISSLQAALLLLAIFTVLAGEVLNTAIEALVDLSSPEPHPKAKIAKDLAASGVLLLAIGAALVGILILGPPFLRWVRTFFSPSVP